VVKHTTATFRQADHHDFLEFPNGQKVLLTDLLAGQEATVLQLPAQPITAVQTKGQKRIRPVRWLETAVQVAFRCSRYRGCGISSSDALTVATKEYVGVEQGTLGYGLRFCRSDRRGGFCTGRIGLRGCPAPRCRPRADLLMAARSICKVVVIGLPGVHKTDFAGSSNVVIAIEARAVNKKGPGA
jgi:hypothetical protein